MAGGETWEVRLYQTPEGRTPVLHFLQDLPAKHRAKVRQAIGRLELFGPRLGFPDSSDVKDTPFRELRTRFAGQQYRSCMCRTATCSCSSRAFTRRATAISSERLATQKKYLADYRSERK